MWSFTRRTLLIHMPRPLGLVAALMVGLWNTSFAQAISIPKYSGPISPRESVSLQGMHYRPIDTPLLWTQTGEIVIAHEEHYSSGDVVSATCGGSGIFILSPQHGTARSLAVGAPVCEATFSHYGLVVDASIQWVMYTTHRLPSARLVRINLQTGHSDSLATGCSYVEYLALSRDNKWVAGTGWCFGRSNVQASLFIARSDGSDPHRIAIADSIGIFTPSWSPDDKSIAFVFDSSGKGAGDAIGIRDVVSGRTRMVTRGWQPSWSPDGQWIAFFPITARQMDWSAICVIRPDGTGEHVVFSNHDTTTHSRSRGPIPEGEPVGPIVWSPDSREIAFARDFDRGTIVWRLAIETGTLTQVTEAARH